MMKRALIVLFTILVTIAFVAPISFMYLLTKPQVTLNEEVFLKKSISFENSVARPKMPRSIPAQI